MATMVRNRNTTEDDITAEVIRRIEGTGDARLRQIMLSLVRHLHAFVKDVQLTQEEWWQGIQFLTRTGHMCDDKRQEFVLLSDTLGVSMVTDLISNRKREGATESTVFGPFHREGAPEMRRCWALNIAPHHPSGVLTIVSGRVIGLEGEPIPGALLDVWQTDSSGKYDAQYPELDKNSTCAASSTPTRRAASGSRPRVLFNIRFLRTARSEICSRPPAGIPGARRIFTSWCRRTWLASR